MNLTNFFVFVRQIAKKLGITRVTVARVLQKYKTFGTVKDRPGRGRKRKLSEGDMKKVVGQAKRGMSAPEIASSYTARTGESIHPDTVRNALHREGLAYLVVEEEEVLSEDNRRKRLRYAREMKDFPWSQVLFSDEKTFQVGVGPSRQWRVKRKVMRHLRSFRCGPPPVIL